MDPEYYMTQQLTDKSDVYSFGVVLLELITSRIPIERGKHIVKLVQESTQSSKDVATSFTQLLDPKISAGSGNLIGGMDKFLDLAMRCVQESGGDRPTMGEVVREIENIMQLASSVKKNVETDQVISYSSDGSVTDASQQQSFGSQAFEYSGGMLSFNLEHHK